MITIHCGESIEDKCFPISHPLLNVKAAKDIIEKSEPITVYSNNPDFVQTAVHYGEQNGITVELFLNGKPSNIEEVFEDFNRCYELMATFINQIDGIG